MHCFKKIWLYLDMAASGVVPSPKLSHHPGISGQPAAAAQKSTLKQ